jgi:hypothetical protein
MRERRVGAVTLAFESRYEAEVGQKTEDKGPFVNGHVHTDSTKY